MNMKKLLTVCIPTYKRKISLRRCIDSVITQIEKHSLTQDVNIYVANDASPDDTAAVLSLYQSLSYFGAVTRERNLGMSVNIKHMLEEVAQKSDYQLIITDDDYLQPDALSEIVVFLRGQSRSSGRVPAIWTPRYSYTDDGALHCVVCKPFERDTLVCPSALNAGRHMANGFVLSGLIVRGDHIDYRFWDQYDENAYFPVIFFGDLLFREGAHFWDKNIVHHTVLNECHWARWGKNDVVIEMRLFSDYVNAYSVLAKRIEKFSKTIQFYYASFPSLYRAINDLLRSDKLKVDKGVIVDAIQDLRARGAIKFEFPLYQLLLLALTASTAISATKSAILRALSLIDSRGLNKEKYLKRSCVHIESLRALPFVLKLFTS
jgi:glycosyltransferase involved in cell wall biosynthesis